jgi:outer membrane protein assembly factor BamB
MSLLYSNTARPLVALLVLCLAAEFAYGQAKPASVEPIQIKWHLQPGVSRYRLQLATDPEFSDIVFDRAVNGSTYTVTDLPRGHYYWRVAPAVEETGRFSNPLPVGKDAPDGPPLPVKEVSNTNIRNVREGWRVVAVRSLSPVGVQQLDRGELFLFALDSKGGVYAFDGRSGEPRWSFAPREVNPSSQWGSAAQFLSSADKAGGKTRLLLRSSAGLRALDLSTGQLLWEKELAGSASGFAAVDFTGTGDADFVVVTRDPSSVSILDPASGAPISEVKLERQVIGKPVPYIVGLDRGFVLSEAGGVLDVLSRSGASLRTASLETEIYTAPVLVKSGRDVLLVVGTEKGLLCLDAATLKPRWRVDTPGDAVTGSLGVADLDANGADDVVMLTRGGVVAVVDSATGKIRWHSGGAGNAASIGFADVNADGRTDVIIPTGRNTIKALSGREGSELFETTLDSPLTQEGSSSERYSLVVASGINGGGAWIFLSDSSGPGLRALSLAGSSNRVATR